MNLPASASSSVAAAASPFGFSNSPGSANGGSSLRLNSVQHSHPHPHAPSAALYSSPHPSLPFQSVHNVNMLMPVHMNMNMPMAMNMNMPMGMSSQLHTQPTINVYYHAHAPPVASHLHVSAPGQANSVERSMLLGVDEEDAQPSSGSAGRSRSAHIRNLQANSMVLSDSHSRVAQQSAVSAFVPAKVVALATPALSTALTAPPTPTAAVTPSSTPSLTLSVANSSLTLSVANSSSSSSSSASYGNGNSNSLSSSLPCSLPSTMEALEQYYYELLSPFLQHFRRTDSALVWLSRASPSSSFSLAVPRIFRNPKSSGGEGGYADAFKKLGLSLREKERKSGHFHLWFCDFRTVNLAALQTALKKRWAESENYSEKELEELMAQANTKNKKEREETEEGSSKAKRDCEKEDVEKPACKEKSGFIDLSTIQSHVSAVQSHSVNSATNVNAKRLSIQQHLAKKQKEKERPNKNNQQNNNLVAANKSMNAPHPAGALPMALPVTVPLNMPVSVVDMGMSVPISMGMSVDEYYPNGVHGYVNSKEYPANGAAKDWCYDKECDSDADSASAKAMESAYRFQAAAKYAGNASAAEYTPAYYPHSNYYVYHHPTAHPTQMQAAHPHLLPHATNSMAVHPSMNHAPNSSGAAVHSAMQLAGHGHGHGHAAYSELPLSGVPNYTSVSGVNGAFHRQTSGNYYRAASVPGNFVEYEDERRLKRNHEVANSKTLEVTHTTMKKATNPSASLPTPLANTARHSTSPTPANAIKSLTSSSTYALKLTANTQNHRNQHTLLKKDKETVETVEMDSVENEADGDSSAMDEEMRSSDDAEVVGHLLQLKTLPNAGETSTKSYFSKTTLSAPPQTQSQAEMMSS